MRIEPPAGTYKLADGAESMKLAPTGAGNPSQVRRRSRSAQDFIELKQAIPDLQGSFFFWVGKQLVDEVRGIT
jgi:hypothetical protein